MSFGLSVFVVSAIFRAALLAIGSRPIEETTSQLITLPLLPCSNLTAVRIVASDTSQHSTVVPVRRCPTGWQSERIRSSAFTPAISRCRTRWRRIVEFWQQRRATFADTLSQGQCKTVQCIISRFECSVASRAFDIVYCAAQQICVLDFSSGVKLRHCVMSASRQLYPLKADVRLGERRGGFGPGPDPCSQYFSQVIESLPGRAPAVPPDRVLIRIKKSRNIFLAKGGCFPRG